MISLSCETITKSFAPANPVLVRATFSLEQGESVVIFGPSGSGKTTLLSILGCLLSPTSGSMRLEGQEVDFADKDGLAAIRRRRLGFVFQHAQLLPFLSVRENIRLVATNAGLDEAESDARITQLAAALELTPFLDKKPGPLSGGERQRVAIARAVVHRPRVVLADEPTAALDWRLRDTVCRLLLEEAQESDATVVVVAHDERLRPQFKRALRLEGGILHEDT